MTLMWPTAGNTLYHSLYLDTGNTLYAYLSLYQIMTDNIWFKSLQLTKILLIPLYLLLFLSSCPTNCSKCLIVVEDHYVSALTLIFLRSIIKLNQLLEGWWSDGPQYTFNVVRTWGVQGGIFPTSRSTILRHCHRSDVSQSVLVSTPSYSSIISRYRYRSQGPATGWIPRWLRHTGL